MGIQELIQTLQHIQSVPDKTKLNTIAHVLSKMDDNQDGSIRVEDVYDVSVPSERDGGRALHWRLLTL